MIRQAADTFLDFLFEKKRLIEMMQFEFAAKAKGRSLIAGLDEAGRGPLAGPVVAAICILPSHFYLKGLNDSKKLSAKEREELFHKITSLQGVFFGIAEASVEEIDQFNILQASYLAMTRALFALKVRPDHLLIDGNRGPQFGISWQPLVQGDSRSASIAAASILAKVTRDRMFQQFDKLYPGYGFLTNKGYGTEEHLQAIEKQGICPIHRKSFRPIASLS